MILIFFCKIKQFRKKRRFNEKAETKGKTKMLVQKEG